MATVYVAPEQWALESVRAFTLKSARKQARKSKILIKIKVGNRKKSNLMATIDGRFS